MLILLMLCAMSKGFAQSTGQYDLQLAAVQPTDCDNNIFYVDLQVRASSAATVFRISDQNYRFRYNPSVLANPRIETEFTFSGLAVSADGTASFFTTHTLNGSLGPVVSYNFELAGGAGYPVGIDWVSVGRVAFDILDPAACIDLVWNDKNYFPPTYVGGIGDGNLYSVDEGSYLNFSACIDALCTENCPATLSVSTAVVEGTYLADLSITSDCIVPGGGAVSFKAGQEIELDVGFSVESQADFSAEIEGCAAGN